MKIYRRIVRKRIEAALKIRLPLLRRNDEPSIVLDPPHELASETVELDGSQPA